MSCVPFFLPHRKHFAEYLTGLFVARNKTVSYVGRMPQLTSLAPDIVESILAGQAFADISLQHCRKRIPVFWEEQRRVLVRAE